MRADKWFFRLRNFIISAAIVGPFWYLFNKEVNDLWFIALLYWLMYVRASSSRFRELNDRLAVFTDLLVTLSASTSDACDPYDLYEATLDRRGFYDEADKLDRLDER